MEEDKISIVITTFHREIQILKYAVKSVLEQTYENIEIIIVDDNGMGTKQQLSNQAYFLGKEKICYIANRINMGAQISRNLGILYASGRYVAFLDDDDWWEKSKLKKQMGCFTGDIALVFCNGYLVDENGKMGGLYRNNDTYYDQNIDFSMMLMDDCVGSTSQAIIRKDVFATVGLFDVEILARQDYEMWIRISKCYKLYGINEPLFYHRIHNGEQISKNSNKVISGYKRILKKYSDEFKENKYSKARMNLRVAFVAFKSKQYNIGIIYSLKALFISPKCFLNKLFNNGFLKKGSIYE